MRERLKLALAGTIGLGGYAPLPAAAIAAVAAAAERWGPGDDNLRVTLACSVATAALASLGP